MKIGSADNADSHGETGPVEIIEVHRFPDGVPVAYAEAGLRIRKSKQTVSGDWVAGEITMSVNRPCFSEELDDGSGPAAAYELVKDHMGEHLPKLLDAIDQLAKS